MNNIFLSIIIPCYNEEENLKRGVLEEISEFLNQKKYTWEVIISDDGSSDKSVLLVKKKIKDFDNFRLLENPHGGKPSALLYGIKAARGEYTLLTDMDQSTPIGELDKLLPYAQEDYDVVIGSRGVIRKDFPLYRKIGAVAFMSIRRLMILPELTDTQCGFKLFSSRILRENFSKLEFFDKKKEIKGWKVTSYDVELLHILKKKSFKIKEVEVVWKDRDISKSKGGGLKKYINESKEMFTQIMRVKLNDLRGMYN